MSTATLISAEEFARMSFDTPVELLFGEIVTAEVTGQRHGTVCANAGFVLGAWSRRESGDWICASNNAGVILSRNPDTVRGPDLCVIRKSRLPGGGVTDEFLSVAPDLVVEVVSHSDRWSAVVERVGQFLQVGVNEVWVLNPEHKRLHLYRVDDEPTVLNADGQLHSQALPGFECSVTELFRGI